MFQIAVSVILWMYAIRKKNKMLCHQNQSKGRSLYTLYDRGVQAYLSSPSRLSDVLFQMAYGLDIVFPVYLLKEKIASLSDLSSTSFVQIESNHQWLKTALRFRHVCPKLVLWDHGWFLSEQSHLLGAEWLLPCLLPAKEETHCWSFLAVAEPPAGRSRWQNSQKVPPTWSLEESCPYPCTGLACQAVVRFGLEDTRDAALQQTIDRGEESKSGYRRCGVKKMS